ncbi:MAG: hypothetical protein R8K46_02270 [Mariprofundaceae bacterium]
MKRREIDKALRGKGDGSLARFFLAMPANVRDSLSAEQKRSIIVTILELQRNDPRILDEIYMEQPYPGRAPGQWTHLDRLKRRSGWTFRRFWLAILRQKSERRGRTRFSDYIFLAYVIMLVGLLISALFMAAYWIKWFLGIDVMAGSHLLSLFASGGGLS